MNFVTHKDLDVWKLSIKLVKEVYLMTKDFPKSELYGLANQMRRVSISIPCNIAEGAARNSLKEFVQFCYIALGSLFELETQIIISHELNYINSKIMNDKLIKVEEIRRKLLNFIKHLKLKLGNKK